MFIGSSAYVERRSSDRIIPESDLVLSSLAARQDGHGHWSRNRYAHHRIFKLITSLLLQSSCWYVTYAPVRVFWFHFSLVPFWAGVLSLFCAKAGAARVYAVEAATKTAEVARAVIERNGFSHVIQVSSLVFVNRNRYFYIRSSIDASRRDSELSFF